MLTQRPLNWAAENHLSRDDLGSLVVERRYQFGGRTKGQSPRRFQENGTGFLWPRRNLRWFNIFCQPRQRKNGREYTRRQSENLLAIKEYHCSALAVQAGFACSGQ